MSVGEAKSPLDGSRYQALSKDYKKFKQESGAPGVPNLDLEGDMLSSLEYVELSGGKLELGVFGDQAPKADGHNNFSGKSKIPERRFLPGEGESFKSSIQKEVQGIVNEALAQEQEINQDAFSEASSSSTFYDALMEQLGVQTRAEARSVVLRTPKWFDFVQRTGLIRWL